MGRFYTTLLAKMQTVAASTGTVHSLGQGAPEEWLLEGSFPLRPGAMFFKLISQVSRWVWDHQEQAWQGLWELILGSSSLYFFGFMDKLNPGRWSNYHFLKFLLLQFFYTLSIERVTLHYHVGLPVSLSYLRLLGSAEMFLQLVEKNRNVTSAWT